MITKSPATLTDLEGATSARATVGRPTKPDAEKAPGSLAGHGERGPNTPADEEGADLLVVALRLLPGGRWTDLAAAVNPTEKYLSHAYRAAKSPGIGRALSSRQLAELGSWVLKTLDNQGTP